MVTWLALAGCCAVLGACGGDDEGDPIPQEVAADMQRQLDNIRGQVENGSLGACEDILAPGNTFEALERAAQRVPERVDPDVRDALGESVRRLAELVESECDKLAEEEEPAETVPLDPEPVPEETTPEETPTQTAPPEEEPGEEEVPPGQGGTPPGQGGTPPGQDDGSGGVIVPGDEE
jgi:hypothetical protein